MCPKLFLKASHVSRKRVTGIQCDFESFQNSFVTYFLILHVLHILIWPWPDKDKYQAHHKKPLFLYLWMSKVSAKEQEQRNFLGSQKSKKPTPKSLKMILCHNKKSLKIAVVAK